MTQAGSLDLRKKYDLSLDIARKVLDAAEAESKSRKLRVSIAVVDGGGHLFAFLRMDGVHLGTVDVAIAKARSAALFKRSTKAFADGLASGSMGMLSLPNVVPFEGGVPLLEDGEVIGAVGVSGASPEEDGVVATCGALAVKS